MTCIDRWERECRATYEHTATAPWYLALSIRQPWIDQFLRGVKAPVKRGPFKGCQTEYRSWRTTHRGPLVLVSSATPDRGDAEEPYRGQLLSSTIALVDLVDIGGDLFDWRWYVRDVRPLVPLRVKGAINLYPVEGRHVRIARVARAS